VNVVFGDDRRGQWTGTVYLGGKAARVRVRVYDKRHERECHGQADPGPWTRVELTFRGGDQGVPFSLQDVPNPTALFWAHIPREVVAPSGSVPLWLPCSDPAGFVLPARQERDPERDLNAAVQSFGWLLVDLADACGPSGRRYLIHKLHLISDDEMRHTPFSTVDTTADAADIPF